MTENPDLKYNDGVTNLFLYTEGTVGGSKELGNLLKHMTNTTVDNALDSDLKQIQEIVDSIKRDKEVGERYMSMEKIMESAKYYGYIEGKEEGFADGKAKGRAEGRAEERNENINTFIETLQEFNIPLASIKVKLLEKFKISEAEADKLLK